MAELRRISVDLCCKLADPISIPAVGWPDEIQRDLDRFLRYYNLEPSHQGYRLNGRTPA